MLTEQLIDQCESPIERRFLSGIIPVLADGVEINCQRELLAGGSRYRVDFWCLAGGRRIIIECDGRDYHDFFRDQARDSNILFADRADEVFRLRGCDVNGRLDASIGMLRTMTPQMFRPVPLLTLAERIIAANVLKSDEGCKPILRMRCRRADVRDCSAAMRENQACTVIDSAPDCSIVQFKSPYWSWQSGKGGDAAWSMAEILDSSFGNDLLDSPAA